MSQGVHEPAYPDIPSIPALSPLTHCLYYFSVEPPPAPPASDSALGDPATEGTSGEDAAALDPGSVPADSTSTCSEVGGRTVRAPTKALRLGIARAGEQVLRNQTQRSAELRCRSHDNFQTVQGPREAAGRPGMTSVGTRQGAQLGGTIVRNPDGVGKVPQMMPSGEPGPHSVWITRLIST